MVDEKHVTEIVLQVIKKVDPALLRGQNPKDINDIPLVGNMESMAMLTLVVGLEDALKKEFGKDIGLLEIESDSGVHLLKTIGTITHYITQTLEK